MASSGLVNTGCNGEEWARKHRVHVARSGLPNTGCTWLRVGFSTLGARGEEWASNTGCAWAPNHRVHVVARSELLNAGARGE